MYTLYSVSYIYMYINYWPICSSCRRAFILKWYVVIYIYIMAIRVTMFLFIILCISRIYIYMYTHRLDTDIVIQGSTSKNNNVQHHVHLAMKVNYIKHVCEAGQSQLGPAAARKRCCRPDIRTCMHSDRIGHAGAGRTAEACIYSGHLVPFPARLCTGASPKTVCTA